MPDQFAKAQSPIFQIPEEGCCLLAEPDLLSLHLAADGLLQVINPHGETEAGIFLTQADLEAVAEVFDAHAPRYEIERRWLVDATKAPTLSTLRSAYPRFKVVRSGVLAFDPALETAARIRLIDNQYLLDLKAGSGIRRRESRPIRLSPLTGLTLMELCGQRSVEKLRFDLEQFELDCFTAIREQQLVGADDRSGLLHVEREFESLKQAQDCTAPEVFGHLPREITDDPRRNNLSYALAGLPSD